MMDFVEQIDSYSPQTNNPKPNPAPLQLQETIKQSSYDSADNTEHKPQETPPTETTEKQTETGCTRFCSQKYYQQYFKVTEKDVMQRILATIVPPFNDQFLELVKPAPDFYGPFWVLTTIVFLLGIVGNFANYVLSKFSNGEEWEGYFFQLELVRHAVIIVYSLGVGTPTALYFIFKFMKCNELSFPEIACLYGYSLSCYIPALLLCIIPIGWLQWIFMTYAFANSTFFLVLSLRKHIEGTNAKIPVVFGVLGGLQVLLFLFCRLKFLSLGAPTQ